MKMINTFLLGPNFCLFLKFLLVVDLVYWGVVTAGQRLEGVELGHRDPRGVVITGRGVVGMNGRFVVLNMS